MTRRRESEEQWGHIVSLLERCRQAARWSLSEAQQWYDQAPSLALAPLFVRSVVAQTLQRHAEQLQANARNWLGELLFSADTSAGSGWMWTEVPRWVGAEPDHLWFDAATVVRSDDVDVRRVGGACSPLALEADAALTEAVVYDVWPDFRELERSEFRRVHEGTVRSDVYLDGRGWNAEAWGMQQELWCDGADHERDGRARIRGN
jgi:hypothetical protein